MNHPPASSMTVAQLEAWATRRGMTLIPVDEYDQLIAAMAADLITQVEAHKELEAEHMNLLHPALDRPRHPGEARCGRPPADSESLVTRLARRLAQHLPRPKPFRLWRTNG